GFSRGRAPGAAGRRRQRGWRANRTLIILRDRFASFGDKSLEPDILERTSESRSIAQGGRPQGHRLLTLASRGEPARLQDRRDEGSQTRHARVALSRFPGLNRADADADPSSQLALGQA